MAYPDANDYTIKDASKILSPGLVIFRELLEHNLAEMVQVAGGSERLCPHCKTHKTREIIEMQIKLGITKHKCATIAEAEMLGDVGVEDVLLAYQMVGPNLSRLVQLTEKFPQTRFACLVDHPTAVSELSKAITADGKDRKALRRCHRNQKRDRPRQPPLGRFDREKVRGAKRKFLRLSQRWQCFVDEGGG